MMLNMSRDRHVTRHVTSFVMSHNHHHTTPHHLVLTSLVKVRSTLAERRCEPVPAASSKYTRAKRNGGGES